MRDILANDGFDSAVGVWEGIVLGVVGWFYCSLGRDLLVVDHGLILLLCQKALVWLTIGLVFFFCRKAFFYFTSKWVRCCFSVRQHSYVNEWAGFVVLSIGIRLLCLVPGMSLLHHYSSKLRRLGSGGAPNDRGVSPLRAERVKRRVCRFCRVVSSGNAFR